MSKRRRSTKVWASTSRTGNGAIKQHEAVKKKEPEQSSRGRGGRPSSYRPEFAHFARGLCWRGATDRDLAEAFDVTTVTIWRWRAKHEEFCNAVKAGKDAFDDRVERSLAQRAMGYSYHVEKVFHFQGRIMRARTVEHPDELTLGGTLVFEEIGRPRAVASGAAILRRGDEIDISAIRGPKSHSNNTEERVSNFD